MSDWYALVGQTVIKLEGGVLENLDELRRFENPENRHVAESYILGVRVSTMFMGLNMNVLGRGEPLVFESMAFWPGEDPYEQARCGPDWIKDEWERRLKTIRDTIGERPW